VCLIFMGVLLVYALVSSSAKLKCQKPVWIHWIVSNCFIQS
jgi:hypothetical protein